jgi:hypothetical protein
MNPNFRKSFVLAALFAVLCSFSVARAGAQSAPPPAAQATGVSPSSPVPARIVKAIDETRLVQLKGNVHPIAQAKYDQGAASDSATVARAVVLLQRSAAQEAALQQLLGDQQNKTSPNFHAWLTPEQYGKQFGPADSDVQTVTQWLNSRGFQNIKVYPGRTAIEFSGNVGQIRETFHTDIHKYLYRGETHSANVSDPQIPEALAPVVAGVVGLHNFAPRAHVHSLGTFRKDKSTGEVKPLFTFPQGSVFAVGPPDFAKIYNVAPLYTQTPAINGSGVTIAVVGDSNINPQDVIDFRTIFGLQPNFTAANNIVVNGPDPGLTADEIEADLDTEWSGAVAPNANILLVVTEQPQSGIGAAGVDLSVLYAVNNNLADVLSKSFGACEAGLGTAGNAFESALYQQASAQGITVMVSSGDSGSAACDPASANNPDVATFGLAVSGDASTPYNVAVGGTDFNQNSTNFSTFWSTTPTPSAPPVSASALGYIPETTWNASCAATGVAGCTAAIIANNTANRPGVDVVGGSGGPSNCRTQNSSGVCNGGYPKPSWQTGSGVPLDNVRDLPDVSLFASNGINNSFYIICEQDANSSQGGSSTSCDLNAPFVDFLGIGGTSASSPSFAGIISMVVQKTGQRQGNINYVLYPMAAIAGNTCTSAVNPLSTCVFYDVNPPVVANNSVACQGGAPNCSNTSTAANAFGILTTTAGGTTPAFITTPNYDLATGLGSVNATNLVNKWTSASTTPTTTTFLLNGGTAVNNTTHGAPITVSGSVSPAPGAVSFTGFVELIQGTTAPGIVIDTFPVSASGSYTGTTTALPGTNGTPYTVVAQYGGDGTLGASTSGAPTQTVNSLGKEASKVVVGLVAFDANNNPLPPTTAATSLTYGSPYILQILVTNSSGNLCTPPPFNLVPPVSATIPCPTGSVSLFDGGATLNDFVVPSTSTATNTSTLNNAGFAEDQPVQLGGGAHSITATYTGDASFSPPLLVPESNTLSLNITPAATLAQLFTSANSVAVNQNITFTAAIATQSNSAQGPTGTVTFKSGSTTIGTAPAVSTAASASSTGSAFATATLTTTFATTGTQNVIATYPGDTNYVAATSASVAVSVTNTALLSTTTTVTSSSTSIAAGGSVTLTARVATTSNGAGPTGTVQFKNGSVALSAPATCAPTAGTPSATAFCTATLTTTLSFLTPPPALQTSPRPPFGQFWLALFALLVLWLLAIQMLPRARRAVLAYGAVLLLACTLAGVSGCGGGNNNNNNTAGPHTDSITAAYSGDANYQGSTSAPVGITVQ